MSSIKKLDGPVRIDPGTTGLKKHSFSFVNTSGQTIHDLFITTWDDSFFGGSPDIVANGCTIETFTPQQGQGNDVNIGATTPLEKGKKWTRDNDDDDAEETRIVFKKDHGIEPGKGVIITLEFDETLDGNEGITVSPSRLLPNGDHAGIGGRDVEPPKPFTGRDLIDILGKVGSAIPIGGLIGQAPIDNRTRFADLGRQNPTLGVAIAASLDKPFQQARVGQLMDLPLHALQGMTPAESEQLGVRTIGEFVEKYELRKLNMLMNLGNC